MDDLVFCFNFYRFPLVLFDSIFIVFNFFYYYRYGVGWLAQIKACKLTRGAG